MFNEIAPRYELINSLFSLGQDAAWRRAAVKLAAAGAGDEALDVACGTGGFARAFASAGVQGVVGCDFAHQMLIRAAARRRRNWGKRRAEPSTLAGASKEANKGRQVCPGGPTVWCEADALRLPFRSGSFTIVSCAFGVRNFADLDVGLAQMHRVLKPGGRAVILEFTRPAHRVTRRLFEVYANHVMPALATVISGDRSGAYRYLPRSVVSFPDAEQMCVRLRRAGFNRVTATPLTTGIVTVYVALRD